MTRAQTLESQTMVTKLCTSTATRPEKLCVSSAMRAMNLSARSSSHVFPAILLSGTARRPFAKVKVIAAITVFVDTRLEQRTEQDKQFNARKVQF